MPVIDANGIFDGDRINKCSVMAQLYYPRLLCASNKLGRIQVNYRKIVAVAFPRWDSKVIPPEPELMGFIKEYAENRLIFLYHSNGQVWGQWDSKPKTFGKYPTNEDKRSPAPPVDEFEQWQKENRQHSSKQSVAMVNFDLVNVSENVGEDLKNVGEGSEKVGNGIGERYEVLGIGKKPSPQKARRAVSHSSQLAVATGENKHQRITGMVIAAWNEHNPGATCPFGESDGKQIKLMLEKTTGWTDSHYAQCLHNLYATEGFPRSELPMYFLPRLPSYFSGPKDRYNRELGNGKGTNQSTAAKRDAANVEALVRSGLGARVQHIHADTGPAVQDRADDPDRKSKATFAGN